MEKVIYMFKLAFAFVIKLAIVGAIYVFALQPYLLPLISNEMITLAVNIVYGIIGLIFAWGGLKGVLKVLTLGKY
ncbi:MAG: hypothetical protein KAI55_00325 [Candidatus Aenigmarchaeota archaeon]|nr:hypothetical protein [Candidatus Aenigmarchaeota archaeon]